MNNGTDEMTTGEMLEDFTLSLMKMQMWLSTEHAAQVRGMYTEHTADNGDAIIILHSDLRALLFSNRSRGHLDAMLSLVRQGITGTEALKQSFSGTAVTALVSGTL